MDHIFETMEQLIIDSTNLPSLKEMKRRTLEDKWINGPTVSHVIEEVHTPLNFSYITFTTGTTAFQNMVGITEEEIDCRKDVCRKLFQSLNVTEKCEMLVTYPLLVNVFSKKALSDCNIAPFFLLKSSRDAFLYSLYKNKPHIVIGESTFIRIAIEDALKLGIIDKLPQNMHILCSGTRLDLALIELCENYLKSTVHDLYGCQEYGWIALDGILLRDDIDLIENEIDRNYFNVYVGGLSTGDSFPISGNGHVCNRFGKLLTYRGKRIDDTQVTIIEESTAKNKKTLDALAKTILRVKSKIVVVDDNVKLNQSKNVLAVSSIKNLDNRKKINNTKLFDNLLLSQFNYQKYSKVDPIWNKKS